MSKSCCQFYQWLLLLGGVSKYVNGYMGEVLIKDVAHFINGFSVTRGLKICKYLNG